MWSFFKILTGIRSSLVASFTVLFCTFLLGFAFLLEYFVDLVPCPLCIAQRFFFFLIGVVAAVFVWWPKFITERIVGIKITAYALLGGIIAARQVWMQWHPPQGDSEGCAVLLGNFIENFLTALGGTGDCAKVDWTFLTLSIAEWSFLCFGVLLLVGLWFLITPNRQEDGKKISV